MRRLIDNLSEEEIQARIKDGYGQGYGSDYKPWLTVRNVSSKGRSCRLYNQRIERPMTVFSKLEECTCYTLMWQDEIIDIREQFPLLPLSETQEIARELGIKHPRAPRAKHDLVMTTDFVVTVQKEGNPYLVAVYVKYQNDLTKMRTREKYMIEKEYWQRRGIDLKIVTENSFVPIEAENISKIMDCYTCPISKAEMQRKGFSDMYIIEKLSNSGTMTIQEFSKEVDEKFGFYSSATWKYLYHLIAHKIIPVDLTKRRIVGTTKISSVVCLEQLRNEIGEMLSNEVHA